MTRWFLLLGLAGCSITLSGPDPNRPRTKIPQCDSGKGLVALDSALAVAAGITAMAVAGTDGGSAVASATLGAVLIASAIHGNHVVDACRTANAEYIAAVDPRPRAPIVAEVPEPDPEPVSPLPLPQPPQAQPAQVQPPRPWAEFWKEVP